MMIIFTPTSALKIGVKLDTTNRTKQCWDNNFHPYSQKNGDCKPTGLKRWWPVGHPWNVL